MDDRTDFLDFPDDAVAIVTGAASGIGLQIALDLSVLGVAVSCWDLSAAGVHELAARIHQNGGRAIGLAVDVTDSAAISDAVDRTVGELGDCGFLVNNAGPRSNAPLAFDDGVLAALGSVHDVTQAWLRTAGSKDGNLVNVASVAGPILGAGASVWYPAAKAGITGLTRHLAVTRPNGIRANAVAPGLTVSGRTDAIIESGYGSQIIERNPFGRPGVPSDVSAAVLFLLAPVSRYLNGILLPVDGGSILVQ